jgi:hypothetical protein
MDPFKFPKILGKKERKRLTSSSFTMKDFRSSSVEIFSNSSVVSSWHSR